MEEKLIQFVKENDIFYNKKNPHYKNIFLKDQKMKELSKQLNIPVKKLKERWRSLKDKYYREIKLSKLPLENRPYIPKRKWKWSDKLQFLNEANCTSKNKNNFGIFPKTEITCDEDFNSCSQLNEAHCSNSENATVSTAEDLFLATGINKIQDCDKEMSSSASIKMPKAKNDDIDQMILEAKKELSDLVVLARRALIEPAEEPPKTLIELFFEGLAKQTIEANLTTEAFLKLQIEMLQCFHNILYNK